MHVLMLLAQVDPPAARALCGAIQKESSDEGVWVYYGSMAPLVHILRLPDLHKAGCALQLPQSRLQSAVAEQGVWVEAAQLLARMAQGKAGQAELSRAADLLQQLASEGFSAIKANPPLLYHNDFTARTRRFYWSEDVGYALWLRLHFETTRGWPGPHEPAPM
jgi:hypothetical protein